MVPESLFAGGQPQFVEDISRLIRNGSDALGTAAGVLVPLATIQESIGVLVVGCQAMPSAEQLNQTALVGHAFVVALQHARAAGEFDLQTRLKDLLADLFARRLEHHAVGGA